MAGVSANSSSIVSARTSVHDSVDSAEHEQQQKDPNDSMFLSQSVVRLLSSTTSSHPPPLGEPHSKGSISDVALFERGKVVHSPHSHNTDLNRRMVDVGLESAKDFSTPVASDSTSVDSNMQVSLDFSWRCLRTSVLGRTCDSSQRIVLMALWQTFCRQSQFELALQSFPGKQNPCPVFLQGDGTHVTQIRNLDGSSSFVRLSADMMMQARLIVSEFSTVRHSNLRVEDDTPRRLNLVHMLIV